MAQVLYMHIICMKGFLLRLYCTCLHGGAVATEAANGSPTGNVAEVQAASVKSTFSCFFTTYIVLYHTHVDSLFFTLYSIFSYLFSVLYCTVVAPLFPF